MSLRAKDSLLATCTVVLVTFSHALAQSGSDADVTKPAGAAPTAAPETDQQLRAAEKRIAELEARLKELEAAVAKGEPDRVAEAPAPTIPEVAITPPGLEAAPETAPEAAPAPPPTAEPVDPTENPAAMLAELERRYLERFGAPSTGGSISAEELDAKADEVSRWAMRQNALLGQGVAWTVRVIRVEPSRRSSQRAVLVCRGLARDQKEELSDDFRVELDAEGAREVLRQHAPDAAFVVHGTFDPQLSFSPEHEAAGPWHRKGHFVGPYCVSNWLVVGESIEAAPATEVGETPNAPQMEEPVQSEPPPSEVAPSPAEIVPAEPDPAPMKMPEEPSDEAADDAAAEQDAARIAAEQEAARIAAEQEAARIAAEQEAARIAAEQEAARLAAEAERRAAAEAVAADAAAEAEARAAAEAEATRIAAEEETARAAAEARANAEAQAAAKAEAERRASDPLWYLTPSGRKMVERSGEQLARTTDAATVAQLVRGYESRLPSAKDDLKPAIEVMLANAKRRLGELRDAKADEPR